MAQGYRILRINFPKKLNTDLPYGSTIPFLGIYPKELETGTPTGICTPLFMAALFTITKVEATQMSIS